MTHESVRSAIGDEELLELIYAMLASWGMHRMGPKGAKLVDFERFCDGIRRQSAILEELETSITGVDDVDAVAEKIWSAVSSARLSASGTQIVAGTKALHHLLPNLIPPVDRTYTIRFFHENTLMPRGDVQGSLSGPGRDRLASRWPPERQQPFAHEHESDEDHRQRDYWVRMGKAQKRGWRRAHGWVDAGSASSSAGDYSEIRDTATTFIRKMSSAWRTHSQLTCRILRHTFCSHLSMRGAPARAIQELAGHADLTMTQRYMQLSPAALDAAIKLLDEPRGERGLGAIERQIWR
jgi:hypothetical protein